MKMFFVGENSAESLPYWFRGNVHFLFFKIFYYVFYSTKAKAVNGKARTYMVGSHPKHGEKELYEGLPNYRLQLTALAASASGSLK